MNEIVAFVCDQQVKLMLDDLRKSSGKTNKEILIAGLKHVWNKEFNIDGCSWITLGGPRSTTNRSSKLHKNTTEGTRRNKPTTRVTQAKNRRRAD